MAYVIFLSHGICPHLYLTLYFGYMSDFCALPTEQTVVLSSLLVLCVKKKDCDCVVCMLDR